MGANSAGEPARVPWSRFHELSLAGMLSSKRQVPMRPRSVPRSSRLASVMISCSVRALDQMLDRPDYHLLVHTAPFGEERFWWRIELFPRLNRVAGFEWATGVFMNQVAPRDATRSWREALKA